MCLAAPKTFMHVITYSIYSKKTSTQYFFHINTWSSLGDILCAETAAVSSEPCHVIGGSRCAWLGGRPASPQAPDEDQMQPSSDPGGGGTSAAGLLLVSWKLSPSLRERVFMLEHARSSAFPQENSCFSQRCGGCNLLIIFYPSQLQLGSIFMQDPRGKRGRSVLSRKNPSLNVICRPLNFMPTDWAIVNSTAGTGLVSVSHTVNNSILHVNNFWLTVETLF